MVKFEILSRNLASRIAEIMGPSSAAAAALRALSEMGEDAHNFEICEDAKTHALILIDKKYLSDPRVEVSPSNGEEQIGIFRYL